MIDYTINTSYCFTCFSLIITIIITIIIIIIIIIITKMMMLLQDIYIYMLMNMYKLCSIHNVHTSYIYNNIIISVVY